MKLPYDALLFDLDGTLTDSAPGIIRSIQAALHAVGVEVSDPALLRSCVGPPLSDSFRELFHLTPEQSATAFLAFRARFETVGIFENSVYDGIPALLGRLRAAGYRLGVATSKPELFARKILEHFELSQEFSVICGASLDESRNQKREVIEDLLTQTGLSPARVLMIGDRRHDVEGAAQNHIDCAGVLYGYGSREELTQAGARYLAETVEGLGELLLEP